MKRLCTVSTIGFVLIAIVVGVGSLAFTPASAGIEEETLWMVCTHDTGWNTDNCQGLCARIIGAHACYVDHLIPSLEQAQNYHY